MGRRSINTTKSGKYMNPTDQARKEARKKELKKNKKQRQLVRAAVLKNKDPSQILEEMEKIDEMEYNVMQPSPLNEKVLRDKRKKLKETFDRVMRLYYNEEPGQWTELKRKEVEYEKKRLKKQQYYESVKYAQSVQIDEIPLPSTSAQNPGDVSTAANLSGKSQPMPPPSRPPAASGLNAPPPSTTNNNLYSAANTGKSNKDSTDEKADEEKGGTDTYKKCAMGIPVGPPPDLFDMPDLDADFDESNIILKKYVPRINQSNSNNSSDNKSNRNLLAISGQNIDDFMKEMENVHKTLERENASSTSVIKRGGNNIGAEGDSPLPSNIASSSKEDSSRVVETKTRTTTMPTTTVAMPMNTPLPPVPPIRPPPPSSSSMQQHLNKPPTELQSGPGPLPVPRAGIMPPPNIAPPPPMVFRPPLPRPPPPMGPNFGVRPVPPGPPGPPPPNMRHPMMSAAGPAAAGRLASGIRIPGPPPGLPMRMPLPQQKSQQQQQLSSAAITTITAKPQIRNLSTDVTRFVPSALRVKRDDQGKSNRLRPYVSEHHHPHHHYPHQRSNHSIYNLQTKKMVTKDDAYMQFMNEMQDLL